MSRRGATGTGGHGYDREAPVNIPKDKIIELIRDRGDQDQVQQAERELPDQADPDQDADLLQRFGINPQELLSKIGGDIPGL